MKAYDHSFLQKFYLCKYYVGFFLMDKGFSNKV